MLTMLKEIIAEAARGSSDNAGLPTKPPMGLRKVVLVWVSRHGSDFSLLDAATLDAIRHAFLPVVPASWTLLLDRMQHIHFFNANPAVCLTNSCAFADSQGLRLDRVQLLHHRPTARGSKQGPGGAPAAAAGSRGPQVAAAHPPLGQPLQAACRQVRLHLLH